VTGQLGFAGASPMTHQEKLGLRAAVERGEPLADFTIEFADGLDYAALTDRLNQLADDLLVHECPHYRPGGRLAVATKAALEREFGWMIRRAPCPAGGYWWEVVVEPRRFPAGLEGITALGLTQPGSHDDGQPYEWP
jgi:hypothetical protein